MFRSNRNSRRVSPVLPGLSREYHCWTTPIPRSAVSVFMMRTVELSRARWLPTGARVIVLEAFVLLGTRFVARFHPLSHPLDLAGYGLAAIAALAAGLSRPWPLGAFGVALPAVFAYHLIGYAPGAIDVALLVTLYQTAAPQRPWQSLVAGVLTVLGYVILSALGPTGLSVEGVLLGTFAVVASLAIGHAVAGQRAYSRQKREEETQRRVTEERLRIARELHDVVSHSISMINVQAGVAAHVMHERPEQARTALLAIKEVSRDTLRELRGILHVLRQVDEDEPRGPAPGLDQLDILVDTTTRAGVPTTVSLVGSVRPLPRAVDLAAYRIVQESLTNVVRHAAASAATVTVVYEPARVVIEVRDDGRGAGSQGRETSGEGHGLAGMRERVAAAGGELEAAPLPGRGFRVRAALPTNGATP